MKVNEWKALPHSLSKSSVVAVIRINSPIPVLKQAVASECVVIRSRLPLGDRNRRDTQWESANARLEDALRGLERHTLAVQFEPALQGLALEQV